MNFNILKNVPSAVFVRSVPARARHSVIATAILLLLVLAGFVHAAGDAEWQAGTKQVNDTLRQLRQQAQGVPEAMRYVNQAENLWKQAQAQWAMQLRNQQQGGLSQIQAQLLAQQQDFMNQLTKQQQFLRQQLEFLNTPLKKRMDEDNLQRFGRLLQPDTNAKGGPGWKVWEEATRQLDSIGISSTSSSSSASPATSSKATNKGGAYDKPLAKDTASNPYANDPNVVDLSGSKILTPGLLREDNSKQFGNTIKAGPHSLAGNVPPPEIPSADYVANQYVLLNSKEWPTKLKPLVEIGDEALNAAQELRRQAKEEMVDWLKEKAIDKAMDKLETIPGVSVARSLIEKGKELYSPMVEENAKTLSLAFDPRTVRVLGNPGPDGGYTEDYLRRIEKRGEAYQDMTLVLTQKSVGWEINGEHLGETETDSREERPTVAPILNVGPHPDAPRWDYHKFFGGQ